MGWAPIFGALSKAGAAVAAVTLGSLAQRYLQSRAVHSLCSPARCISVYSLPVPPLLPRGAKEESPGPPSSHSKANNMTVILLRLDIHHQEDEALDPGHQAEYEAAAQQALAALWSTDSAAPRVVGIDCEWQPERKAGQHNRVALIQLSGPSACVLVRPQLLRQSSGCSNERVEQDTYVNGDEEQGALTGQQHAGLGWLPRALVSFLEDPSIIKAGVGCYEDGRRLLQDFGVQTQGLVDVRMVAGSLAPWALVGGTSLAGMAATVLGRALDKRLQCSNWGSRHLTKGQLQYAAADAWVGHQLLLELYHHVTTTPSNDSDTNGHERPAQPQDFTTFVAPFADARSRGRSHSTKALGGIADSGSTQTFTGRGNSTGRSESPLLGLHLEGLKPPRHACREKALYENARIQVKWYLDRQIAVLVHEDPPTIRLLFEPRGRGAPDDAYYSSDKENRCVVCGASAEQTGPPPPQQQQQQQQGTDNTAGGTASRRSEGCHDAQKVESGSGQQQVVDTGSIRSPAPLATGYLRHSIVPHTYRRHFPLRFKSHLSHDIVLLCLGCHQICGLHDQQRVSWLAKVYNAPLSEDSQKGRQDYVAGAVRSAARALLSPKIQRGLPEKRREELQGVVAAHFDVSKQELTQQQLEEAANLETMVLAAQQSQVWQSHSSKVVTALLQQGGEPAIEEFVRDWRQHFLQAMRPQFLPPYWSVGSRTASSVADEASTHSAASSNQSHDAHQAAIKEKWFN